MMTPEELKTHRAAASLTQAALGAEVGVTQVTIARWETGVYPISRLAANQIKTVCGRRAKTRSKRSRTMQVYKLSKEVLDRDYHGCGHAWAALNANGEVIALRYMEDSKATSPRPDWVRAVSKNAEGLDSHMLPDAWSYRGLSKIARAVAKCDDRPRQPRGGDYKPAEYLTMARAALATFDIADFEAHRTRCRKELFELGTVISGMCSSCEFVVH